MEEYYSSNIESRDREYNYKVFEIFRSFRSVSGPRASQSAFHYWWLFTHYFITFYPMGDQIFCEKMIGMKHNNSKRIKE